MPPQPGDRRDFFISFNSANRTWAEWIASELEKAGYTTYFQHWDFRPGSNFVLKMNKAAARADRTVAVLSPEYLNALFTQPEWAAALVQDPAGAQRKLIPVRIAECQPDGLLSSIVYADLVGLGETEARERLLAAVSDVRPKPDSVPYPAPSPSQPFPGSGPSPDHSRRPPEPPGHGNPVPDGSLLLYAALSLVCFLLGVGLLALMLWKVETLARFGLTGKLFYLVLIPIALSAAGFLFGVLRSIAIYRGAPFGGNVELHGPIVAAALVVLGGFVLPPPEPGSFSITVFVHGPAGPQDTILRGKGKVVLDLQGNRRYESIDEKGASYFPGIPATFRGQEIPVSLDAEGFEPAGISSLKLNGDAVYLPIRKSAGKLSGNVVNEQGDPVGGADIDVEGFLTRTETTGRFTVTIPGERLRDEMNLRVRAPGFQPQTHHVVPGSNEIQIQLLRRK